MCVTVYICVYTSGVWEFKNSINLLMDLRSTVTKSDLSMFNLKCFEHRPLVFVFVFFLRQCFVNRALLSRI